MNARERAVHKRRVLMAVQDVRPGARRHPRHFGRKTGVKSRLSIQNMERHTLGTQTVTPGAGGVQTAHGLPGRVRRPANKLDDESLCSARRQRENDLKDCWLSDEALPWPSYPACQSG